MKKFLKRWFSKKDSQVPKADKPKREPIYPTEEELRLGIDELKINGFYLPNAIIKRFKNDTWKVPVEKRRLEDLIKRECPFSDEVLPIKGMIKDFTLYSLGLMKNESEVLYHWLLPKWKTERIMFLGKKDNRIQPGNIDTGKVILFGDLGLGSDTPFGLDYRDDPNNPSVILLYWGENCQTDNRWKKIANSFEEFEKIIWEE